MLCVLILGPVSTPTVAPGICSDYSFKCKNGDCVNKVNAECDRVNDCSDQSDEAGCGEKCAPPPTLTRLGFSNVLKQLKVDLISSVSFK